MFLIFFIYIIKIGYWISATFTFKCRRSTAAVLVFLVFLIKKEVFAAEETSGLHKRQLLKYHESFPILVFMGSLSIEIAL